MYSAYTFILSFYLAALAQKVAELFIGYCEFNGENDR